MLFNQSVEEYTAPVVRYAIQHTSTETEAKELSLEELAEFIAKEEDFNPEIVKNVIDTETGRTWDCSLVGKDGELGCLQIIPKYHNVDPLDFEASVRYFISEYKAGRGYQWTGCSCTSTARLKNPKLPRGDAKDLKVNTLAPKVGDIVKFNYDGIYHVAYIEGFRGTEMDIFQGNKSPCKITTETISVDDPRILGYWSANPRQYLEPVVLYSKTEYLQ